MKLIKPAVLSLALVAFSGLAWSQDDGAAIYKSKCAACHGAGGEGKVGPALKGTSLSEDDVIAMITKGNDAKKAPHKKPIAGLTDAQAKAVATYVKSLK
jgi:mono/diheme cytochrome c family protein